MNNQLQALEQSIEEYKFIQEKHIRAFETELVPDIELQNFERAHAFAEMKNNFDKFFNKLQDTKTETGFNYMETVAAYITEIKRILNFDAILKKKILIYKKELKQHLNHTGKVRTAFNGYAASANTDKYTAMRLTS